MKVVSNLSIFVVSFRSWSFFVMDNLLKAALNSQTVPSGILCIICWLGWPTIIAILREFQGKDRLQFNCDPKQNEYTTQQCYRNYNSDFSPRLTPLNVAGITFGVSGFGWLTVTLLNVWLLRRIRDEENNTIREKKKGHFYWTFICHICCQLAFLVVMMGLFCHHQKREYPAEYRCFSANTTFTCNDSRYKDKSTVNIAIIVVFVLSIVFCLVAIIHLILNRKKTLKHLLGNVEEDTREENRSLGELICYHLYIRILQVLSDSHSLKNFLELVLGKSPNLKYFHGTKNVFYFSWLALFIISVTFLNASKNRSGWMKVMRMLATWLCSNCPLQVNKLGNCSNKYITTPVFIEVHTLWLVDKYIIFRNNHHIARLPLVLHDETKNSPQS